MRGVLPLGCVEFYDGKKNNASKNFRLNFCLLLIIVLDVRYQARRRQNFTENRAQNITGS